MKAMILVLTPEEGANLLNGDLSILARKKFPSDYVGWVYTYVTKDKDHDLFVENGKYQAYFRHNRKMHSKRLGQEPLNGKVIAKFWCDKVEEIIFSFSGMYTKSINHNELLKLSCLTNEELEKHLPISNGKAIHVTDPKPFDEPKEISEFYKLGAWKVYEEQLDSSYIKRTEQEIMKSLGQVLTSAPRNGWCYVEEI